MDGEATVSEAGTTLRLKRDMIATLLIRMDEEKVEEVQLHVGKDGRITFKAVETIWKTRPFPLVKRQERRPRETVSA